MIRNQASMSSATTLESGIQTSSQPLTMPHSVLKMTKSMKFVFAEQNQCRYEGHIHIYLSACLSYVFRMADKE